MKKALLVVFAILLVAGNISAQTVYITKTGKKYHSAECNYLSKSSIPIELKDAQERGYTACSKCDPPSTIVAAKEGKSDSKQIQPATTTVKKSEQSTQTKTYNSGRCQATTKKGTQCKRSARPGSNYCWQHGG